MTIEMLFTVLLGAVQPKQALPTGMEKSDVAGTELVMVKRWISLPVVL